jgi:hypothetical protein
MDSSRLKAPSLSSLISGTDRGSSDSLLGSLNLDFDDVILKNLCYHFYHFEKYFQIDDLLIPPVEELPSLDAVMSEFDSDLDSINNSFGDNKFSQTPTPSFDDKQQQTGSILRHVIFQGVTAQIGSAAVSQFYFFILSISNYFIVGSDRSWFRIGTGRFEDGRCGNFPWIHFGLR